MNPTCPYPGIAGPNKIACISYELCIQISNKSYICYFDFEASTNTIIELTLF